MYLHGGAGVFWFPTWGDDQFLNKKARISIWNVCWSPPPKRWELSCCDSVLLFNIKAFHKQNEIESIESTAQPRASSPLFSQRAAPVHTVFLSETPVSSNIPKTWTSGCLTTPKVVLRCPRFQQWSGDLSRLWPREAPGALQTPPVHEKSQELNATIFS